MSNAFDQMMELEGELIDLPSEADDEMLARQRRVAMCGQFRVRLNPATGECVSYHAMCGDHELCLKCLIDRVHKYRNGRVHRALPVKWVRVSQGDVGRLLRKAGKREYLKCPQRDGSLVVFMAAEAAQEAERRTGIAMQWYNLSEQGDAWWQEVVNTPRPKRISGSLGLDEEDKKKGYGGDGEEKVEVVVEELAITKGDQETVEAAVVAGIEDTGGLDPRGLDELKKALATRMQAIRTRLARAGCEYFIRRRKVGVHLTRINWLSSTDIPPNILAGVPF